MGRQPAFWLAVAGVSLIAQPVFGLLADSKVGDAIPGLRTLYRYQTRQNG